MKGGNEFPCPIKVRHLRKFCFFCTRPTEPQKQRGRNHTVGPPTSSISSQFDKTRNSASRLQSNKKYGLLAYVKGGSINISPRSDKKQILIFSKQ